MKFQNITTDERHVLSLGFSVEPGAWTPELTDEQAVGLLEQTDVWTAEGAPSAPVVPVQPQAVPAEPIEENN